MLLCSEGGKDFAELEDGGQVKGSKIQPVGKRWQSAVAILLFLDECTVAVFRLDIPIRL